MEVYLDNSLKRFSREKEQQIIKLQDDVEITNWENKELKKEKKKTLKNQKKKERKTKHDKGGTV